MGNRYLFSDPHHGQDSIYRFTGPGGGRIRPWAENAAEGDEMMIEAWNRTVNPKDTVYHLGDVAMARKAISILSRLNGRKILIRGNHDIFKLKDYTPYFEDLRGSHKIDRLFLSHLPIHPDSVAPWCHANVHGHIHANQVTCLDENGNRVPDLRYINMCVEVAGLAPVPVEQVAEQARQNFELLQERAAASAAK